MDLFNHLGDILNPSVLQIELYEPIHCDNCGNDYNRPENVFDEDGNLLFQVCPNCGKSYEK